jgi:rubredoxin
MAYFGEGREQMCEAVKLHIYNPNHSIRGPYAVTDPKTWMCLICGWIYDEATGAPEHGIAAGTAWAQVPMNWTCPECGARKEDFEMVQL